MPPMGHVPPKKSGALKWILGGLGCFGVLALCCFGGIAYFGYASVQMVTNNPAYLEGRASLENSEPLGELLGNPITVGDPTNIQTNPKGERVGMTYEVSLSGPNGTGSATITVDGKPFSDDWNLESLTAEVNGENVPLDGGGLDINIEE